MSLCWEEEEDDALCNKYLRLFKCVAVENGCDADAFLSMRQIVVASWATPSLVVLVLSFTSYWMVISSLLECSSALYFDSEFSRGAAALKGKEKNSRRLGAPAPQYIS